MKRIKRLVFIFVILLSVVLLSACKKDYSSITYKRFTAKMSDELGYSVTDNSLSYEGIYERYISASKEGVIFIFMEFEDKDSAESYMKGYEKQKGYSYNKKDHILLGTLENCIYLCDEGVPDDRKRHTC